MSFANPWLLLLLVPLALALWRAWAKPSPSIVLPSAIPFRSSSAGHGLWLKRLLPFSLYALAGVLMVFAIARPRHGIEEILQRSEGIDIMLAIDLSGSMSAYDIPDNIKVQSQLESEIRSGLLKSRIDIAKDEIKKFILARPNDRIGLIGFGPLPYAACPPTLDHAWLIANLAKLDAGIIGDGTGIAGPVASATQRLKGSEAKRRVMVLFTDGSNNINAKVSPRQAAKLAASFDVVIYTVGIGSPNAAVIRDGFFGKQLIQLQDEFDEPLLKDMAATTGGRYYKAADAAGMAKAMDEIDKLEKTIVEQPRIVNWKEWGPTLCAIALFLALAAFALESTLFLRIP